MATHDPKHASDLGEQAIALAEQLGRMAGTIEGTAEAWLNRQKLADQLTRVRDSATQMLESLGIGVPAAKAGAKPKSSDPVSAAAPKKTDPARAPGKRRRKPAPATRGVKKSNETIPKMRTAKTVRQRRKSYA